MPVGVIERYAIYPTYMNVPKCLSFHPNSPVLRIYGMQLCSHPLKTPLQNQVQAHLHCSEFFSLGCSPTIMRSKFWDTTYNRGHIFKSRWRETWFGPKSNLLSINCTSGSPIRLTFYCLSQKSRISVCVFHLLNSPRLADSVLCCLLFNIYPFLTINPLVFHSVL